MARFTVHWKYYDQDKIRIDDETIEHAINEPDIIFTKVHDVQIIVKNPKNYAFLDKLLQRMPYVNKVSIEGMNDFPTEILTKKLKEISIHSCNFTTLPSKLINNPNNPLLNIRLKKLRVFNTPINQIPDDIDKLIKLNEIVFADTRISNIPKTIGNLPELRGLYITDSEISEVPEELFLMKNLNTLDLEHNKINKVTIPSEPISVLHLFDLDKNKIFELPHDIDKLFVEEFIISNNNIVSLEHLPKSIKYDVSDNPIENITNDRIKFPLLNFGIFGQKIKLPDQLNELLFDCSQDNVFRIEDEIDAIISNTENVRYRDKRIIERINQLHSKDFNDKLFSVESCKKAFELANIDIVVELSKAIESNLTPEQLTEQRKKVKVFAQCKDLPSIQRFHATHQNEPFVVEIINDLTQKCKVDLTEQTFKILL